MKEYENFSTRMFAMSLIRQSDKDDEIRIHVAEPHVTEFLCLACQSRESKSE